MDFEDQMDISRNSNWWQINLQMMDRLRRYNAKWIELIDEEDNRRKRIRVKDVDNFGKRREDLIKIYRIERAFKIEKDGIEISNETLIRDWMKRNLKLNTGQN
jgi:hypothetical protein